MTSGIGAYWLTAKLDAELLELAKEYVAGHIYTNFDVPEKDMPLVFMPLALMRKKAIEEMAKEDPVMIYASIRKDKTFRMGVNGVPMFASCAFLRRWEYKRWRTYVDRVREALGSL